MKAFIYFFVLIACSAGVILHFTSENKDYSDHYYNGETVDLGFSDRLPVYELTGFHTENAVIRNNQEINATDYQNNTYAALMINNTDNQVIVAHNAFRRIYPASMTKLVTAMLACEAIENGTLDLDQVITLTHDIEFPDFDGAMHSGMTQGCQITVRNLMYGFMMCSFNDFGVILGEQIAGSEAAFVEMMNQKMVEIGATNCHFANTHGLDDLNHYVTAYDMYLIIREASKHQLLEEIDSYKTYTFFYKDENGEYIQTDLEPTNRFVSEEVRMPSNIKIKSWKTGTTELAGYCLAMILDINEKEYTIVVTDSESSYDLYDTISAMFNLAD